MASEDSSLRLVELKERFRSANGNNSHTHTKFKAISADFERTFANSMVGARLTAFIMGNDVAGTQISVHFDLCETETAFHSLDSFEDALSAFEWM